MRVLWVCNVSPIVRPALGINPVLGGWLQQSFESLQPRGIQLAVVFPGGSELRFDDNGSRYYQFKQSNFGRLVRYDLRRLLQFAIEFQPDVVHFHGAEQSFSHEVAKWCRVAGVPYLLSIQGIVSELARHTLAGINAPKFFPRTLLDVLAGTSPAALARRLRKLGQGEFTLARGAAMVLGRTSWDKAWALLSVGNPNYLEMPELVRPQFLGDAFSRERSIRRQLFVPQAFPFFKGAHIFFEALKMVVVKYPDVNVVIAGKKPRTGAFLGLGYDNFILQQASDANCDVQFVGYVGPDDIRRILSDSSLLVLPSLCENSPASIAEALQVGLPVVASYVGGVPSLYERHPLVTLYQSDSPLMLADKIIYSLTPKQSNVTEVTVSRQMTLEEYGARLYHLYLGTKVGQAVF
jgi:glycosyltransferase involved in cell wall biosynthesis